MTLSTSLGTIGFRMILILRALMALIFVVVSVHLAVPSDADFSSNHPQVKVSAAFTSQSECPSSEHGGESSNCHTCHCILQFVGSGLQNWKFFDNNSHFGFVEDVGYSGPSLDGPLRPPIIS